MNSKKSFILGFTLALILVAGGVQALTAYYMNVNVGFVKMPSTFTRPEISLFLGQINTVATMFNKNNSTTMSGYLPPLQENATRTTRQYSINNMEHKNVTVTFDSISGIPDGALVTIVYKMNDLFNIGGRLPYDTGTTCTLKQGDILYFWIIVDDMGLEPGTYTLILRFHSSA